MRSQRWSRTRFGIQSKRAGGKQSAQLRSPHFRRRLAAEHLEQRLLLSAVVALDAPSANYTTTWTNSGPVAIGVNGSPNLVSGLNAPRAIAVSGGDLWVANDSSSTISEYNATTGAVVNASLVSGLNGPLGIAVSGGDLWVANNSTGTISEYNATTGAVVNASLVSGFAGLTGIAVSGGDLWITNYDGPIAEYNATTGAVVNASLVSGLTEPEDIAVSGGEMWVLNYGAGTIGEYNATTGAVINASLVSGLDGPTGITVSGADLWVPNNSSGTIGEYNATTGAVVNASLISGLNGPVAIAVSGSNLWVANGGGGTIGDYNATTGTTPSISITDAQSATLSSLTITIENPQAGDVLTATASGGVTVTPYNAATGVLQLRGAASLAAYETVLASVLYNNTSGGPSVASETIDVVANDGISNSSTTQATIAISPPPVVELDAPSANYTTSWTNSGPVTISVNGSPNLVTGLNAPQGIVVSGGDLWIANTGSDTIGDYNAITGAVVNSSLVSGLNSPYAIAVSGGDLWVANHGSGTIGEYNATTGAPITVSLVSGLSAPTGVAVSGGDLWVANGLNGTIGEYNATTGAVVNASLVSGLNGLNGPFGIAVSGANLWVTSEGSGAIGEYNATTGATVNASLVSGLNGPFGIAVSGPNLWVANTGGSTIGEYNATTGAAVNDSLVSGLNSPLGIAVLGGDLWVTNSSSGTIGQYNATTGAALTTPSITDGGGATLSSLTVILMNPLAGDVLTATAGSGITVTPYNPPTGALLLSGLASLADYETVLASVQYNNIDGGPGVASESISIVANNGISSSNTAVSTIAINAPPVVELNPSSTNYATSWTNSGAVAITPNASTMFVSGLDNPNAIAVAGDDLWVANYNSGTISEYNATTGAVINAALISGLNGPVAIVVSGGNLWVANYSGGVELPGEESGSIGEYNATTGAAVNAELVDDTGNLQGMAMSGGTLWVTGIDPNAIGENSGFIEDYDAASGDAIGNQPGPTGQMFEVPLLIAALNNPTSIAVSGGNLWVDEGGGFGEYNATTGAVLAGPSGLSGPGRTDAVAVSGGDLFLANTPLGGTGRISEFNATTGVLINAALVSGLDVNSFSYPASIAVAGVNLWVANDDGTIDEYNANTGAPAVSAISIADGESRHPQFDDNRDREPPRGRYAHGGRWWRDHSHTLQSHDRRLAVERHRQPGRLPDGARQRAVQQHQWRPGCRERNHQHCGQRRD